MVEKKYRLAFILVTSLFFMWGFANNITDTLVAAFRKIMTMNDTQSSLVQMSFYGAYFCLALPAAYIIRRYSYKTAILVGLAMFAAGGMLFYPASISMEYNHFLVALFVLAGGLSILETAANPYILKLGSDETGVRRLNLAQSFNPIGSNTGYLVGSILILGGLNAASAEERAAMNESAQQAIKMQEIDALITPYLGVAIPLIIIWILIYLTRMPSGKTGEQYDSIAKTLERVFSKSNYRWGVLAQFLCVGAQIGVWSFTIRYVQSEFGINEQEASYYQIAALVLFTFSRFIATGILVAIRPGKLLAIFALLASICCFVVVFAHGYVAIVALILISGFMSLMFPTIFGLSVRGMGKDTEIAGAGLIMAIVGGAIVTPLQGLISDASNIHYSYLIPALCFIGIMLYAILVKHPVHQEA